MKKYKNIILIF